MKNDPMLPVWIFLMGMMFMGLKEAIDYFLLHGDEMNHEEFREEVRKKLLLDLSPLEILTSRKEAIEYCLLHGDEAKHEAVREEVRKKLLERLHEYDQAIERLLFG